jgi:hypothetical protein
MRFSIKPLHGGMAEQFSPSGRIPGRFPKYKKAVILNGD